MNYKTRGQKNLTKVLIFLDKIFFILYFSKTMRLKKVLTLTFLLLAFFRNGIAQVKKPDTSITEAIDILMKEGDAIYESMLSQLIEEKIELNRSAIAKYKQVLKLDHRNYEALWKIGRSYRNIGEKIEEWQKLAIYNKAAEYCEKAIGVNPDGVDGHFYLSVVYGRIIMLKGVLKSLSSVKKVKKGMETVLKLDPTHDGAHHVLALWYREVPWFFGGRKKEAVKELKLAIKYKPDYTLHHLELGKTYIKMKKYDLARDELNRVLSLPDARKDDFGNEEKARQLLEEIKNK